MSGFGLMTDLRSATERVDGWAGDALATDSASVTEVPDPPGDQAPATEVVLVTGNSHQAPA